MNFIKFNHVKLITAFCLPLYVTGCSYIYGDGGLIQSKEYDYTKAETQKALIMPKGLNLKSEADYTQLPTIGKLANNSIYGKSLNTSAPIQILAVLENTRVDHSSKKPAVYFIDDSLFIWNALQKFLDEYGIKSNKNKDDKAIILTDWVAVNENGIWIELDGNEEPDLNRAKFKFTMVKSNIPNEIKLIVERTNSESRDDDDLDWQEKPATWSESADMMNLFLSYYDKQQQIRQFNYQQKVMAGFKVALGQNDKNEAILTTTAKHSLVWEKTPKVVLDLGFKIIDKDVRQNTYYLELKDPEPGFFASLFDDSDKALPLDAGTYQVVITESGGFTNILFKDEQGAPIESKKMVKLYPMLSRLFGDRR